MYIEGVVSLIDEKNLKVRLTVEEFDNFTTPWLVVPQLWTVENKSKYLPKLNTLMSAILSDDMSHGAILGAIYNDEDTIPDDMQNKDFIKFQDGSSISHSEEQEGFTIVKNLRVIGDIVASGNISDNKSSMQDMRDTYNSHKHPNGNNGSPTGATDKGM